MNTLFDIGPVLPQGFTYFPSFITAEEEKFLLETIASLDLQPMKFHEYEAKRKVISFGSGWSFTGQCLKAGNPIPQEFQFLVEKIAQQLAIPTGRIAQFLVTEYPPGSVINWHRDAPPFDIVAGVSLLNDCIFKLRPHQKEMQTRQATVAFPVQKRSLYTMLGQAKTDWQHCTAPLSRVRYSLTFRTLNQALS